MDQTTVKQIISSATHKVFTDENGEAIVNEDKQILICDSRINSYMYVPLSKEISNMFGIFDKNEAQNNNNMEMDSEGQAAGSSSKWSEDATRRLIHLYRKNEKLFLNTAVRNDTVYQLISDQLADENINYSSNQCKDKFKYLKMRYMKVIDSQKTTGSGTISFNFFDEMDEIFGKKANATPVALASSSKSNEHGAKASDDSKKSDSPQKKKKKLEDTVERRHKEKLDMQDKAIKSFEDMMKKLIEKM